MRMEFPLRHRLAGNHLYRINRFRSGTRGKNKIATVADDFPLGEGKFRVNKLNPFRVYISKTKFTITIFFLYREASRRFHER